MASDRHPGERDCVVKGLFSIFPPFFLKGGRGDFESPMRRKPLESPSIPLYNRGKQNLVPWDLHRAFLNCDTVSKAGVQ